MSKKPSTKRINLYQIKPEFVAESDIIEFENSDPIRVSNSTTQEDLGYLFIYPDSIKTPSFIKMLKKHIPEKAFTDGNKQQKAIWLLSVNKRMYAITFGNVTSKFKEGVIEERFGLRTLLNLIDSDGLKSIEKKVTVRRNAS